MSRYFRVAALLTSVFLMFTQDAVASSRVVKVAASIDDLSWWQTWLTKTDCQDLPDLGRNLRRNELELVLLCRALRSVAPDTALELITSANYARNLQLLLDGKVHVASETIWSEDADGLDLRISLPVLEEGRVTKGIYTRVDHPLRELQPEQIDLTQYRGVTMSNWVYDWELLNTLTPKTSSALNTYSVHKIINAGRADFTLAEFPSREDMMVICEGEELYPVPGIKVAMPWSRHFAVANKAKDADEIYTLLNKGLAIMRESNQVEAAYASIGFFNPRANNWALVGIAESPDKEDVLVTDRVVGP